MIEAQVRAVGDGYAVTTGKPGRHARANPIRDEARAQEYCAALNAALAEDKYLLYVDFMKARIARESEA